jgi:hypothetical protein
LGSRVAQARICAHDDILDACEHRCSQVYDRQPREFKVSRFTAIVALYTLIKLSGKT